MDTKVSMAFGNPYAPVITQVSMPFASPIIGGLTNEKQIHIQGVVQDLPAAKQFSVNLCEGSKITPNCVFHFNPRFHERCIVRNAMRGGSWGTEEREGGIPIVKGQTFEIIILCAPSGYFVAVNGRHFTEFKHRMPMSSVKYLLINGDFMKINFIKYEGTNVSTPGPAVYEPPPAAGFVPSVAPPPYTQVAAAAPGMGPPAGMVPDCKGPAPDDGTIYSPSIPLTLPIPGGRMSRNRAIYISGIANPEPERFSVNLRSTSSGNYNFHFDVRFNYGSDHNVVVRNSLINGQWGKEERRASCFPFSPNASFDLIIVAESSGFKVMVNNAHFTSYAHRQPLQNSDILYITGDVRITALRFQ